jgi:hypothetical protein
MKIKKPYYLFVFYIVISIACNVLSGPPSSQATPADEIPPASQVPQVETATKIPPLVASGNGPEGFSAEATSADSVKLTWQAVDSATSYHVTVTTNGGAALTVIDLPSSITEYEDFLVAPDSQLIYAVEAVSDSTSIGQSVANVTTPARQPNPLQVLVEFDTSAMVSQKIGPAGGTISVLDSSGVSYELSIPPNALNEETEISLTTIANLYDWPLDGEMIGAVGIEPEGLALNEPAILTITPPSGISVDGLSTVGFAFQGYGQEFSLQSLTGIDVISSSIPGGSHLASPVEQATDGGKVIVLDLKPRGIGQISHEQAKELIRNNLPSDSAAAMDQKQVVSSANNDELQSLPYLPWRQKFNDFRRRLQGVSDCRELRKSLSSLVEAIHDADEGNDHTDSRIEKENEAWDETIEKTKEMIDKAADECKEEKSGEQKFTNGPCALGLIKSITSPASAFDREFQKRFIEKYKDTLVEAPRKIKDACDPGYVVYGSSNNVHFNGKICSLEEPFTINGVFPGGAALTTFTPSSSTSGSNVMSGSCGQSGGGSYTILIVANGSGSINWSDAASISCAGGGSKTNNFSLVLHKIEGACAK